MAKAAAKEKEVKVPVKETPEWKNLVLSLEKAEADKKAEVERWNERIKLIKTTLISLAHQDDSQQELPLEKKAKE